MNFVYCVSIDFCVSLVGDAILLSGWVFSLVKVITSSQNILAVLYAESNNIVQLT